MLRKEKSGRYGDNTEPGTPCTRSAEKRKETFCASKFHVSASKVDVVKCRLSSKTDETLFTINTENRCEGHRPAPSVDPQWFLLSRSCEYTHAADWLIDAEVCSGRSADWMMRSQRCVSRSSSIPSAWPHTPAFRVQNRYFSALQFPLIKLRCTRRSAPPLNFKKCSWHWSIMPQ